MDEFKFPTIRLSAEEEKEVALRAENGDKEARELLILSCDLLFHSLLAADCVGCHAV